MPHCRKLVGTLAAGIIPRCSIRAPRLPAWRRRTRASHACSGSSGARSHPSCGKVESGYTQRVGNQKLWKKSFPQCKNFPQGKRGRNRALTYFPAYALALLVLLFLSFLTGVRNYGAHHQSRYPGSRVTENPGYRGKKEHFAYSLPFPPYGQG